MSEPSQQWKRQAAALFESSTDQYASGRENEPWYRTQLNFAMAALAGRQGRVLDLGCAAGVEIAALRAAGFSVVGADFVEPMLHMANRRFAQDPQVSVTRADAEFLPFAAASFDSVFCLGVLEYLPSYEPTIREIHRVLRPGGMVVITVPSRVSLYNISYGATEAVAPLWRAGKRLLGKTSVGQVPAHHRNLCVPWRFRAQLSKFGLEPVSYASTAFFLDPLIRFWPEGHHRLAAALERFGRSRWIGWAASQFMVAARKKNASAVET